jgi:FkbM family methyltransferase
MTSALPTLGDASRTRRNVAPTKPMTQRATLHDVHLEISALSQAKKDLILQGRYAFHKRRLLERCLLPDDVVLELGGGIGYTGIHCRKIIGLSHHLTIEANPNAIRQIRGNYALNDLEPHILHAAAAAEDGEISINIAKKRWEHSLFDAGSSDSWILVPAYRLGSLVKLTPKPPTAFICDIGGAETRLDFSQLPDSVTRIIIDLHPDIVGDTVNDLLIRHIRSQGFVSASVEENIWWFER